MNVSIMLFVLDVRSRKYPLYAFPRWLLLHDDDDDVRRNESAAAVTEVEKQRQHCCCNQNRKSNLPNCHSLHIDIMFNLYCRSLACSRKGEYIAVMCVTCANERVSSVGWRK